MRVETGDGWELRCGDCEIGMSTMIDNAVDAVICDPPFSSRTHSGVAYGKSNASNEVSRDGLSYSPIGDVQPYAAAMDRVSTGWVCVMCDHVLIPEWESAFNDLGRYVFAPVPIVTLGMGVRLQGDGPSSWAVYMIVSRPRGLRDGTKPGAYITTRGSRSSGCPVRGAKPLSVMEAILDDYTNPGDLVCDPFVGSGTTAVACIRMGRRFIGFERDESHFDYAIRRLRGRINIDPRQEELL